MPESENQQGSQIGGLVDVVKAESSRGEIKKMMAVSVLKGQDTGALHYVNGHVILDEEFEADFGHVRRQREMGLKPCMKTYSKCFLEYFCYQTSAKVPVVC